MLIRTDGTRVATKNIGNVQQLCLQNKSKSQPGNLRYRMVVEVSDPLGVAQRESKLAGLIKNTAPDIVIRKVYDQVVERTIKQLKKEDVEADVKLEVF